MSTYENTAGDSPEDSLWVDNVLREFMHYFLPPTPVVQQGAFLKFTIRLTCMPYWPHRKLMHNNGGGLSQTKPHRSGNYDSGASEIWKYCLCYLVDLKNHRDIFILLPLYSHIRLSLCMQICFIVCRKINLLITINAADSVFRNRRADPGVHRAQSAGHTEVTFR